MLTDAPDPQPQAQAPAVQASTEPPQGQVINTPLPETVGGKAGPAKPWMAQLKGHLQANDILSKYDDFSSVAEKVLEFEGKRDRLVEIPGQDATDDVKAAYRQKLGIPAGAGEYKFAQPTNLPDGMTWDKALQSDFQQKCFDLGISQAQYEKLVEYDTNRQLGTLKARNERSQASQTQAQATIKAQNDALHTEWGLSYEVNKNLAIQALERTLPPDFKAIMTEAKMPSGQTLLDDPRAIKVFFEIGKQISDTPFIKGAPDRGAPGRNGLVDISGVNLPPGRNKNR